MTTQRPPETDPDETDIRYRRSGTSLRVTIRKTTNHELREVLVGLFATLDADDRADHLNELLHYAPMLDDPAAYPDRHLSPLAAAIVDAVRGERAGPDEG